MEHQVRHIRTAKKVRLSQDKIALEVMLSGIGSILRRIEHYPLNESASEFEIQLRHTYDEIALKLESMPQDQEP